jgi:DNA-binding CsgD family transcriptional regulator
LYVEKRLTTYEIADRFDTTSGTISSALESHGIESRSGGSGLEYGQPWHDEDTLRELYVEKGLTADEVADRLGCSQSTVLLQLRKSGIPRRHNHPHFKTREDGYEVVRHKVNGEQHIVRVHRLVAVASGELDSNDFCKWEKVVHHKKPIPWLNTHGNLEVMDRGEHQTMHMLEYHSD